MFSPFEKSGDADNNNESGLRFIPHENECRKRNVTEKKNHTKQRIDKIWSKCSLALVEPQHPAPLRGEEHGRYS